MLEAGAAVDFRFLIWGLVETRDRKPQQSKISNLKSLGLVAKVAQTGKAQKINDRVRSTKC
ncbi:hypothetical protein E5S67_05210 [Microcoleus sp. IPMA8]|uniref:Uncharacterized protein n=1 Tax=Microcoleus asticus IPMA8 TaxID=2563858 RepID=A0ABX2D453_9CYAN|nr:hypothetical protein [Microcoleus asticus IPMA8]